MEMILTHTSNTGFSGLHQKLNTEVSHLPKMVVSSASIPAIKINTQRDDCLVLSPQNHCVSITTCPKITQKPLMQNISSYRHMLRTNYAPLMLCSNVRIPALYAQQKCLLCFKKKIKNCSRIIIAASFSHPS